VIQLDKEQAIMVREPDATMQSAPQDNQLMSKHRVLGFKPQLRLEWLFAMLIGYHRGDAKAVMRS
jgi:hypothetical protein